MALCCSLADPPKGALEELSCPYHSLSLTGGKETPPSPADGAPTWVVFTATEKHVLQFPLGKGGKVDPSPVLLTHTHTEGTQIQTDIRIHR